jgi:hypothetical protein
MCISNQPKLSVLALALMLGAAAPGCMKPNPLVYTLGDGDSESSGDDDAHGDGDGTNTPGLPDMASGETTDGNACAPLEAFEPACESCLGTSCCELALGCEAIDDCPCLASCVHAGGSSGACKNACNGTKADMPELDPLLACMDEACESQC